MKAETYESGGNIECPVCGDEFGELWDYPWGSNDEIDVECPCCGAPITLCREVSVDYSARPREVDRG